MRPSPGNCSAVVMAPTALTAPATQARITAGRRAYEGEPLAIRRNSANRQDGAAYAEKYQDGFPAKPVRQCSREGRDEDDRHCCGRGEPNRVAFIQRSGGNQECRNIGNPDIICDGPQGRNSEGSQDAG